jgi:hypothetical protein
MLYFLSCSGLSLFHIYYPPFDFGPEWLWAIVSVIGIYSYVKTVCPVTRPQGNIDQSGCMCCYVMFLLWIQGPTLSVPRLDDITPCLGLVRLQWWTIGTFNSFHDYIPTLPGDMGSTRHQYSRLIPRFQSIDGSCGWGQWLAWKGRKVITHRPVLSLIHMASGKGSYEPSVQSVARNCSLNGNS